MHELAIRPGYIARSRLHGNPMIDVHTVGNSSHDIAHSSYGQGHLARLLIESKKLGSQGRLSFYTKI